MALAIHSTNIIRTRKNSFKGLILPMEELLERLIDFGVCSPIIFLASFFMFTILKT